VVLALPGAVLGDFAIPSELFSRAARLDGHNPYRVITCGTTRSVRSTACEIKVGHGLEALNIADTLIVAGISDINLPVSPAVTTRIRRAAARGCRIASICSGAFVLAWTGLLDGRRATTHWKLAAELSRRYPRIQVEPDVLYVDNGNLLTSAGATSGVDLCLHMIRKDHGAAVAAELARLSVAALERSGGQAQFIRQVPPVARGSLQSLQDWVTRNLSGQLGIARLARRHATSPRTLHRHFLEQTGLTPTQWILQARIRRAQELLETTALSIELVAHAVGFSAASTFRQRFSAMAGTSPLSYRRLFRRAEGSNVTPNSNRSHWLGGHAT
jgi:transcriptional regulator GlxA family with amidase domain